MANKLMAMRSSNVEVQATQGGALRINGKDFADFVKENLHTGDGDYTQTFRARIHIVIDEVETDFEFVDAAERDRRSVSRNRGGR